MLSSTTPSSVMKEKIKQAQDARRQRLRTRLEEMAATGNSVQLSPASPGRGVATSPGRGVAAETPQNPGGAGENAAKRGLHVHFPDPEEGAAAASSATADSSIEPYRTPSGSANWAGLRLEIESPPGAADQAQWPKEKSDDRCVGPCACCGRRGARCCGCVLLLLRLMMLRLRLRLHLISSSQTAV